MASSPRDNRPTGTDQTPRYAKRPSRSSSSLRAEGLKALRNTSPARRQAAKLRQRFGPLTPSARSASLIAGDGTKNGFPAPYKEPTINQNHYLTGKAPYRFESGSLQRRVVQTIGSAWKTFSERDSEFERQVERVALPVIADAADGARRQGRFRVLTWQDTTEATLASA